MRNHSILKAGNTKPSLYKITLPELCCNNIPSLLIKYQPFNREVAFEPYVSIVYLHALVPDGRYEGQKTNALTGQQLNKKNVNDFPAVAELDKNVTDHNKVRKIRNRLREKGVIKGLNKKKEKKQNHLK